MGGFAIGGVAMSNGGGSEPAGMAVSGQVIWRAGPPPPPPGPPQDYINAAINTPTVTGLSQTGTITTTVPDTVVLVFAYNNNANTPSVSGAGLTWTMRRTAGSATNVSLFWAHADTPLTNETITATVPTSIAMGFLAFAIDGVANPESPFDTNPSVPAISTGAALTLTTSWRHTFVIGFTRNNVAGPPAATPPWYSSFPAITWGRQMARTMDIAGSVTMPTASVAGAVLDALVLP